MSVVCKTEPDETEATTMLQDPASGGRQVKEEEKGFQEKEEENGLVVKKEEEEEEKGIVVKEEEEEQKVFKAEDVDDAVLPGECWSYVTTIEHIIRE